MISKRISPRKDGRSSAAAALRYGAGLTGHLNAGRTEKCHRMRLGGFGLVANGVYRVDQGTDWAELVALAALEMQANCDLNSRVQPSNKIAHFVFSFGQLIPTESVLRDVEDSTLASLNLANNHFATFVHSDNGHWHLHVFASRLEKERPYRGNSLWRDKILRDKVCREVEIRHGLPRDNGLHRIADNGEIIVVPFDERSRKRDENRAVSGSAKHTEMLTGTKSFQTWCIEIRIGDRLRHATSWNELHAIAAAYTCEIKLKGAGFVITPVGQKGGIQLSKVGLKGPTSKLGPFVPATPGSKQSIEASYQVEPTKSAAELFEKWKHVRREHAKLKRDCLSTFKETAIQRRVEIVARHRSELAEVRATATGAARRNAIAIKKMEHASALTALAADTRARRSVLYQELAAAGPAATFRGYLQQQAQVGDDASLVLARSYGVDESTTLRQESEALKLRVVATITGKANKALIRPSITHRIEQNGTVVFDLGLGRIVSDSAISRRIQLNAAAANDVQAIETALRFAVARFGRTLTLSGSPEFQRLAVETAVHKRLNVSFTDPALEEYREHLAVLISQRRSHHVHHARKNDTRSHPKPGDSLPSLFPRDVVPDRKKLEVLLPADGSDRMGELHGAESRHPDVRRTAGTRRSGTSAIGPVNASSVVSGGGMKASATAAVGNQVMVEVASDSHSPARHRRGTAISNKPDKGR